ncbi:hypothetical protein C5167_033651 [Papaver somniferum]|uniref:CCHC-type domain-containing protein n=1 Tax=Papaver somniferum TaxID=3469 RepID=A0A4Y7KE29_PAPSO|nr:hypothetical protein C5167_033651 [Papaver somniferum]
MENKILHPPSPRKHGRPTSKRRRSYDEPQAEVRKMRCTQCGSTDGHNKRTCKGGDVEVKPALQGVKQRSKGASYVGESSSHGLPPPVPNTQRSTSAGPSNTQNFSQSFAGIGYMAQNIATVTNAKGKGKKK